VTIEPENLPDDIAALQAALAAEREARQQAEARASSAEALIAHYKLLIAKLRREQYRQSAERGRKLLDQLELQLEEAVASAAENEVAAEPAGGTGVAQFTRRKPVRAPFPAHLPRERVVVPAPKACPCCGGKLAKLGLMPFTRGSSAASSQMISHDRSRPPSETRTISRRGE